MATLQSSRRRARSISCRKFTTASASCASCARTKAMSRCASTCRSWAWTASRCCSNDLGQGAYDVRVKIGPAYATRRAEAADAMLQFIQAVPQAASVAGDLVARNMDWPGADEIADRLKRTLPPQSHGRCAAARRQASRKPGSRLTRRRWRKLSWAKRRASPRSPRPTRAGLTRRRKMRRRMPRRRRPAFFMALRSLLKTG